MTKIKNDSPLINITSTNQVKYVGDIPICALTGDCSIDETNLTYLISILLTRYCSENNVIDADLSSVDLTCLIASNPDIEIPESVTIETLATYYKDHFCSIYSTISDLQDIIDSIKGITCLNDIVQLDQNASILIDPLFNDITDEVTGTITVTITSAPINGTATVATNKITYTPNEDFFGNDQITYQVAKGGYTCSAKISIKVNEVVSTQTITEIVIEQITDILQSDEYWDIGIPIGTKLAITEAQLANFNLVGGSWGAGSGKYSKWAICNGNNGTDDYKGLTTRGYDVNDSDYDDASSTNSAGSDSVTLTTSNIPPHRHKSLGVYIDYSSQSASLTSNNATILKNAALSELDGALAEVTTIKTLDGGGWSGSDFDDTGAGSMPRIFTSNTGDGTDNVGGTQGALKPTPDAINIRNKYFTEIMIQKIA
jgi:hypothetical protein